MQLKPADTMSTGARAGVIPATFASARAKLRDDVDELVEQSLLRGLVAGVSGGDE